MEAFVSPLEPICRRLNAAVEFILFAFGVSMAVIVATQVFSRYVLNHSLFWSEELARFILVWLSFLGATSAYYRGVNPGVEAVYSRMKGLTRRTAAICVHLASLGLFSVMVWFGTAFAHFIRMQISPALGLPKWMPHLAVPLAGAILVCHALNFLLGELMGKGEERS